MTNYSALIKLNIPALSKIQDKMIFYDFENINFVNKSEYLIIFRNCKNFSSDYLKNLV